MEQLFRRTEFAVSAALCIDIQKELAWSWYLD